MTNQGFEILEHTADLRIKARGKTKEELFVNALKGMAHVQKSELPAGASKVVKKIKVESADLTALLIDFLSKILTQSHIDRVVFYDAKFKTLSDTALEAEIEGIKVDEFDEDIKAVTYHGAEVVKNEQGLWEVTAVYDI